MDLHGSARFWCYISNCPSQEKSVFLGLMTTMVTSIAPEKRRLCTTEEPHTLLECTSEDWLWIRVVSTVASRGWEMNQHGSFPSPIASHSTCSNSNILNSVHAFDNIFLWAVTPCGNASYCSEGHKPWQIRDRAVFTYGHWLEIFNQGTPVLKMLWTCCLCCLTSCSELPLFLKAQSCVAYWRKMQDMWIVILGGTENHTEQHMSCIITKYLASTMLAWK